jgi:hypothetical protein
MSNPTERLARIYHYIVAYAMLTGGMAPSYQDIMEHCGLGSKSVVYRDVHRLVTAGLLAFETHGKSRSLRICRSTWRPPSICPLCGVSHPQYADWSSEAKPK